MVDTPLPPPSEKEKGKEEESTESVSDLTSSDEEIEEVSINQAIKKNGGFYIRDWPNTMDPLGAWVGVPGDEKSSSSSQTNSDDDEPNSPNVTSPIASDDGGSESEGITPDKAVTRREEKVITTHVAKRKKQRSGKTDAVLELPQEMQGPAPQVPAALFVQVDDRWFITRSFHSWLKKLLGPGDMEMTRPAKIAATTLMAASAYRFKSPVLALATVLTYVMADYTDPDPTFKIESTEEPVLEHEERVNISSLVAVSMRSNQPLNEENVTKIAATFVRRFQDHDVRTTMPYVVAEWKRQRDALRSPWTFQRIALIS